MTALIWISLCINGLLGTSLALMLRAHRSAMKSAASRINHEQTCAADAHRDSQELYLDYCKLAETISTSLEAIREDIDRNYHHTHEGHVLDRIAYALRKEVKNNSRGAYEISLDGDTAMRAKRFGAVVSAQNTISLAGMLQFGWHLHALSRARSRLLEEVVRQPCGNVGHAMWMSKTLAIYELMCGRDKDLAVKRMSAVIEAWKHEPEFIAARYIEDVRFDSESPEVSTEFAGQPQ